MEIEPFYFENLAYVKSKVSSTTLEELKKEATFILENSNQFKKYNKELAGNL
jgi:aminoglycoside phosphotransferase family enzyme